MFGTSFAAYMADNPFTDLYIKDKSFKPIYDKWTPILYKNNVRRRLGMPTLAWKARTVLYWEFVDITMNHYGVSSDKAEILIELGPMDFGF